MNMFIFDYDMQKNVESYPDVYTYKILLESVQVLSSAYYFTNQPELAPYKLTHSGHPVCRWCRESQSNWNYLYELALHIYAEYNYRYGKSHKSGEILLKMIPPTLPVGNLTNFPQCFDEVYRCEDVVSGYRKYFIAEKTHIFKWKNRNVPDWVVM
jgi:hypothetical protein